MSTYPGRWNRQSASAPARPCPRQWGQPLPRFPWRRLRSLCAVRDVGAGSGGFKNHDLARWLAGLGAVHVWADLDEPDGIEAAGVLAGRVVVLGGVSWIERVGVGADPGEAGAPFPPLDAAAVESYAGDLERDGLLLIPARPK